MISLIQKRLKESADLKYKLAQDSEICNTIQTIANQMVSTFKNKGKVLLGSVLDDSMAVIHDNPSIKINVRTVDESTNDRV